MSCRLFDFMICVYWQHFLSFCFFCLFSQVLSLIILICYASSRNGGYTAAAVCEMCFAIVFFCVFMMDLDKQFTAISWVWSDLIRAFTGTLVYLITSLVCVISGAGDGVFGLLAGLLFAYDTYTIYLQIKSARSQTEGSGRNISVYSPMHPKSPL
uniref:Proteolipid protein 2b n=1 Tax=Xiphophorus couchianus TaxID=32473 RepID=A0A3B5MHI8_9TELE